MPRKEAMELEDHIIDATWEEKIDGKHGVWHHLGRHGDKHVADLGSALVLGYSVAQGQNKSRQEHHEAKAGELICYLKLRSASISSTTEYDRRKKT